MGHLGGPGGSPSVLPLMHHKYMILNSRVTERMVAAKRVKSIENTVLSYEEFVHVFPFK